MKRGKAIEHLNVIVESGEYLGEPDDSKAVKLGIEALKRLEEYRKSPFGYTFLPLPGETED